MPPWGNEGIGGRSLIQQIVIGALMVLLTTSIHGVFTYAGITALRWRLARMERKAHTGKSHLIVSVFVLWMFVAHLIEIGAWAGLYRGAHIFDSMETAFYFSSVTYTTLGYGDIAGGALAATSNPRSRQRFHTIRMDHGARVRSPAGAGPAFSL